MPAFAAQRSCWEIAKKALILSEVLYCYVTADILTTFIEMFLEKSSINNKKLIHDLAGFHGNQMVKYRRKKTQKKNKKKTFSS